MSSPHTARLNMRLSPDEKLMLDELAEQRGGLSMSAMVRVLVREAHAATFGPPSPPKRRSRR